MISTTFESLISLSCSTQTFSHVLTSFVSKITELKNKLLDINDELKDENLSTFIYRVLNALNNLSYCFGLNKLSLNFEEIIERGDFVSDECEEIIDRLYGEWMYIWTLLTHSVDKLAALTAGLYDTGAASTLCGLDGRPILGNSYHIPLPFYFARNPSAAVPLIALQYHEVKINIMWNKTEIVQINSSGGAAKSNGPRQANLICDYVYLDVEERRRMAQDSHEYLIEQTQYNEDKGVTGAMIRCDLTFNHPVKELVWVVQNSVRGSCTLGNAQGGGVVFDPLNFTENAMYSANLQLNGQDRMQTLYSPYFNAVQVYQHHTGGFNLPGVGTAKGGIYCYSFALKPEEHQPSGTCNFSRIDSATLVMTLNGSTAVSLADTQNYDVRVYAINYNILRVMSGMGGLAYSN